MKSNLAFVAIGAALITLSSCAKDGLCIKGSGSVQTETRELNAFNKIMLDGSADIYLRQDTVQSVVIEAQGNILDALETNVSGNYLLIGFEKHCIKNHEPIKVYLTVTDLEEVKIKGSGNIYGSGIITVNTLTFDIEGSGDIELENLHANELTTLISGSGNATYHGTGIIQHHSIDINGSGKIKAFELPTNSVHVDIDGSGDCKVHAVQQLKVNISGSGDVYYLGSPSISSNISGSGTIINAN